MFIIPSIAKVCPSAYLPIQLFTVLTPLAGQHKLYPTGKKYCSHK